MKINILLLLSFIISINLIGQDIITTRKGDEIHAKVIEITQTTIKYKRANNPDSLIYNISKNDVFMIKYKDGSKDLFQLQNNTIDTSTINNSNTYRKSYPINSMLNTFKTEHHKPYILYDYQINIPLIKKYSMVFFYGLDFSAFSYVSENKKGMEKELKNNFIEWNYFFYELFSPTKMKDYFGFSENIYVNTSIKTSYNKLNGKWILSFPYNVQIEQVADIVKGYQGEIKESAGIGFVLIVESFNKETNIVTAIPTFFDLSTFEILWSTKIQEKPGAQKNRNRWSYGLLKVLKTYAYKVFDSEINRSRFLQIEDVNTF